MANDTRFPTCLTALACWVTYNPKTKKPSPRITHTLLTYIEASRRSKHVGFVFKAEHGFVGIDIDALTPISIPVLERARELGAYVEQSPSDVGWHIIGRGHLTHALTQSSIPGSGIEAYCEGRYFTMTGKKASGDPQADISEILTYLDMMTGSKPSLSRQSVEEGAAGPGVIEAAQEALRYISPDVYDTWIHVGMGLKADGVPFDVWNEWSMQLPHRYPGEREVRAKWGSFQGEGYTLGTVYHIAREGGWPGLSEQAEPDDFEDVSDKLSMWERLLASGEDFARETPPAREWLWRDWVPFGVVTGIAGMPGVSKSTLGLQLCAHACAGLELVGEEVAQVPALFVTVEDDRGEMHRRVHRMAAHPELAFHVETLTNLGLVSAVHEDTTLVDVDRDGRLRTLKRLDSLKDFVRLHGFRLVVLDLVGDFWTGNENARGEVTGYVRGTLARWAAQEGIAIVVIMHLNKSGGLSGSTGWEGSFRSLMTMTRSGDETVLERVKANYAPPGEPVPLLWEDGYLRPKTAAEEAQEEAQALQEWLGSLPSDVWMGVDTLRDWWGRIRRDEARRRARNLQESGHLEHRAHNHGDQWRKA